MSPAAESWDPHFSQSWAGLLGLVHVPLFGPEERLRLEGDHAVLLDGSRSSFAFSKTTDPEFLRALDPLSWYWSANLRHAVIIAPQDDAMFVRRWDARDFLGPYPLPPDGQSAEQLLSSFGASAPPLAPNVVRFVLHAFRLIRQAINDSEGLAAVRLLNAFLLAVRQIRQQELSREDLLSASTFRDVVALLNADHQRLSQVADLPEAARKQSVGTIPHAFLDPEPRTGCRLHADLLFRHAASELYQEAHVQIERERQTYFSGLAPVDRPPGQPPRDVRFTPANLARALVQQALAALDRPCLDMKRLVVLDPACGSGVFLRECLRELIQRGFAGHLVLLGYDISPISASIASFALSLAKADIPEGAMRVEVRIEEHDALLQAWDPADLILMNPPFVAIDSLATHELHAVKDILGGMAKGRVDMAMAFAWKAAGALRPGGVMATVLPAPLLDSKGGCAWREELARNLDLTLLGRFEGYNYFRFSMVETAFLVLRRKPQPDQPTHVPVRVLIAEEGTEDAALRLLRLEESAAPVKLNNVDVFHLPPDSLQPQSWLPLRRSVYELRDFLLTKTLAPTKALFDIRQGARTGQNRAFVLSAAEVDGLPSTEREFFRPAGGQGTLWGGRLQTSQFVFYPYGPEGLTLRGEDDLRQQVPTYFRRWLHPNIESLKRRKGAQLWWALTRPRRWQFEATPKLLSKYFGMAGSFAYDSQGHYAVVQGFAWLWKGRRHHGGRVGDCQTEFHHTPLPWAYLALLNSAVFAQVLRCFCPRVQGGQFDLSSRFVRDIPIPDLAEAKYFSAGLVDELEQLGKAIDRGEYEGIRADLNRPAARVYGVPQEMWDF